MSMLINAFIISIGINLLMFLPAYKFKTDKLTDISYAITFITVASFGFLSQPMTLHSVLLYAMILLWALRIGAYLFIRIQKTKKDKRFDGMRESFWGFLKFWILQGLTVWIVLIPTVASFGSSSTKLTLVSFLGLLIFFKGLLIETVADAQKFNFKSSPQNSGKWIESGLWKYSRHPNYLGEILVWIGVYLYTLQGLSTTFALLGLISPIYIFLLLRFVSGVPLLEKSAEAKWGSDPAYKQYKESSGLLLPKFGLKQW